MHCAGNSNAPKQLEPRSHSTRKSTSNKPELLLTRPQSRHSLGIKQRSVPLKREEAKNDTQTATKRSLQLRSLDCRLEHDRPVRRAHASGFEIGRASCRERCV